VIKCGKQKENSDKKKIEKIDNTLKIDQNPNIEVMS